MIRSVLLDFWYVLVCDTRAIRYFAWYEADILNQIGISGHATLGSIHYGRLDNYACTVYVHVDKEDTHTHTHI